MSAVTAQSTRISAMKTWSAADRTDRLNDPSDLDTLEGPIRAALQLWVDVALTPAIRPHCPPDSYQLKHVFERDTTLYCTNGQFKGAMLVAGYEPIDAAALNWAYRVTKPCQCQHSCGDRFRLCRKHVAAADLAVLAILIAEARR